MDLISVIVPVYNVEQYIEECINSILSQSYQNIEVIIVNDGSTDKSGEICETFKKDKRVTVLHKENGGSSSARNYGLKYAKGEYIAFIDSDDCISSFFLESLYLSLKEHSDNCKISMCRFTRKENNLQNTDTTEKLLCSKEVLRRILYQIDDTLFSISPCNKLYHRSVFSSISYPEGLINEDMYVICETLSQTEQIAIIDCTAYYYRINSNSITQKEFTLRNMDVVDACDHIIDYVQNKYHSPALEKAAINLKFRRCFQMLYKLWQTKGDFEQQERLLYSFIKNNKFLILKDSESKLTSKITAFTAIAGKPIFKLLTKIIFARRGKI